MPEFIAKVLTVTPPRQDRVGIGATSFELESESGFRKWVKAYPPTSNLIKKSHSYSFNVRAPSEGDVRDTVVGAVEVGDAGESVSNAEGASTLFERDFGPFLRAGERQAVFVLGKNASKVEAALLLEFIYKFAFTGYNEWRNKGKP